MLMKRQIQAFAQALLIDLADEEGDLSARFYIKNIELRNRVAALLELCKRNEEEPHEWAVASSLALECLSSRDITGAEFKAGYAITNCGNAVWYAAKGDVETAKQRALAAVKDLTEAAEAYVQSKHENSEEAHRLLAISQVRARVSKLIAEAAIYALFTS